MTFHLSTQTWPLRWKLRGIGADMTWYLDAAGNMNNVCPSRTRMYRPSLTLAGIHCPSRPCIYGIRSRCSLGARSSDHLRHFRHLRPTCHRT